MRYRNENWPVDGEYTPVFSGFKLTANTNSTVGFTNSATGLAYSMDNGSTWTNYSTAGQTLSLNAGQTICFRRRNTSALANNIGTFELTGSLIASGNIMSLLSYNYENMTDLTGWGGTSTIKGIFHLLFSNCTALTDASSLLLPATTLSANCYNSMFWNCSNLVGAPSLPAVNLEVNCYGAMFNNCSSLTTAPELAAPTLQVWSYQSMFSGCTSLNYIKCLATDITASSCTGTWTNNVSATGTFVKNANMTSWTTGVDGIPSGWTVIDN